MVESYDLNAKSNKYGVKFYGIRQTADVKEIAIYSFLENKSRLGKSNRDDFIHAMKEAELNPNIRINSPQSSLPEKSPLNQIKSNLTSSPAATSSPLSTSNIKTASSKGKIQIAALHNKLEDAHKTIRELKSKIAELESVKNSLTQKTNMSPQYLTKPVSENEPSKINKPDILVNFETRDTPDRISLSVSILNNHWLTDDPIQYYFNELTSKVVSEDIYLMKPVISQGMKCLTDINNFLDPVLFQSKYVIIPVNDSPSVDKPGGSGSHWSLLLYVRDDGKFFYFDSSKQLNYNHAKVIATVLSKKLGRNENANLCGKSSTTNK